MAQASFRFHGDLNDFFPEDRQHRWLTAEFKGHETVKHIIESLGVPHTEVDVILINGQSVGFDRRPVTGDRVEVYPSSDGLELDHLIRLCPLQFGEPKFVLDGHLGKLAAYLRLLGFDALYRNDYEDAELAEISSLEDRILLTRDRGLLKRSIVQRGYCVREKSPRAQVVEIVNRYDLAEQARPFSRCANCNGLLTPVSKADVFDRLEPKTKIHYDDFHICQDCNQIYWKGSHFRKMERFLEQVLRD